MNRLKSTRKFQSAAIKAGLLKEPLAAREYSKVNNDMVNLAPIGIVVNKFCPQIAASPDRKVYDPNKLQKFGLLEMKYPQAASVTELNYLHHDAAGNLKLKTNHNYYYQVQKQMAVCGLTWCDFFVLTENDFHSETIQFDQHFWLTTQTLIDKFYFEEFVILKNPEEAFEEAS